MHTAPQTDEIVSKAKVRRLRYIQLILISPSVMALVLAYFRPMSHFFGWIGRAIFFTSPLIFLYNIVVYFLLARRLNQSHSWIETTMMGIIILASFLLLIITVFLIRFAIWGGDMMPVPAG